MKRPGYREAVEWIALNDDCEWLFDEPPIISVTAAMVRDLWNVDDKKIFADIKRVYVKANLANNRNADRIDGYDRDDLGESPDY